MGAQPVKGGYISLLLPVAATALQSLDLGTAAQRLEACVHVYPMWMHWVAFGKFLPLFPVCELGVRTTLHFNSFQAIRGRQHDVFHDELQLPSSLTTGHSSYGW